MSKRKNRSREFIDNSDDSDDTGTAAAKKAKVVKQQPQASSDADLDDKLELSPKRFVTVRTFKGRIMVDIREYWDSDGELKPGKKGISLSLEQWEKLKGFVSEIDKRISGIS
ncbi:activated RNA polymerase II transcriptional coactivator p15-like [Dysidea avara]|uniref:activated RNA polymerase II transcriptional coactivator p15-like n=1 Tax=Dysidea avara TaxID=196820 RepID=UPI003326CAAE